jgi:dTDP-3-amino-3,4,6-trideoxy-alpha-D-glucose transaminase
VYLLGDETRGLEADLAGWATNGGEQPSHAVAVASGATALQLTLRALGVGPGDEVIVPAFTAVPTASAVAALGATPVLVDVEAATANLDARLVDAARTARTRAVVVVHLYGRPATLPDTDLPIVEDAAQAQGALCHDGRSAAVAYSFYPTKNLGGIGDGGAVVSTDRDLIDRVARLRTHGMTAQYVHDEVSQNFRLSEIEAAWLRLGPRHAYHLCVARFADRDTARARLAELGVGTAVHYPLAVNQQPAYRCLSRTAYPQAEAWSAECVSLPCFAQMTDAEVDLVASALATLAPETDR